MLEYGIDRRVVGLLIAAPNEWMELREYKGERQRGNNDTDGSGDVEHINVDSLGSVTTLMLIEFQVIGLLPLLERFKCK